MAMRLALIAFLLLSACTCPPVRADEFDSKGVTIHYTVQGHGKPVVLVHGLYSSGWINWQMPGTAAKLAKNFQVITLDNRGHGQSGKPTADDQYGTQMCEDVVRLLDHLHIKKASVVGYSLGGFIVMKLLTMHPERIESAALCGAAWLRAGSPLDRFWLMIPDRGRQPVPAACLRGVAKLGTTAAEVKAINVPVALIVGDRDPCRMMYFQPLRRIRPDWPFYTVANASHFSCIAMPEFERKLEAALASGCVASPRQ